MKLIEQIEVAYFRSFYKDQLSDTAHTNVIFGRNDSGKSNLLRALNLFFNNETNPGLAFRFDRDLSHTRLAEAESPGVRKFVYVKVWFQTPPSWRASLGASFWVKKQWSVTTADTPNVFTSIQEARRQQYLTRFLNKVRFHYIPAIKDRGIFESLLADIYKVVAAHTEFSGSLRDFADTLRARTNELSEGLLRSLGMSSVVSTPQDLTALFRSLDFETKGDAGDAYSLTMQRGDGIQVRHIPPILAFLSDQSPEDYHIWGFEEPENSLELATAIEEARAFRRFGGQRNKQIFLTSHSPAFFSLDGSDVSRYFVSRSEVRQNRPNSVIRRIGTGDLPGELMGETPHLPIISGYLAQAHREIELHTQARAALQDQLAEHNQSVLFVEGESDRVVLSKAWAVLYPDRDPPFRIEEGGGTVKMESLGKDGAVLRRIAPTRRILVLVDNDSEGRALYRNARLDAGGVWVRHNSNGVFWCRLPIVDQLERLMTRLRIDRAAWPGTLENLMPAGVRQQALEAGVLSLSPQPHSSLLDTRWFLKVAPYVNDNEDLERHFVLTAEPQSKIPFAQWIADNAEAHPEVFEPLRGLLGEAERIVQQ